MQNEPSARTSEQYDFRRIEKEANDILEASCRRLLADVAKRDYYASLFDRSRETGFYALADGPRGAGEQPTWAPNPAYMDSLEEMWIPVAAFLEQQELVLEKTLRQLFFLSPEYKDRAADHRRIFHGHLLDARCGKPVTYFMLNIPHSHAGFKYLAAPRVHIADSL